MRGKIYPIILCLAVYCNHATGQIITTIAGDGTLGTGPDGMEAILAWTAAPSGAMKYGDKIYYSESRVDKVRFIGADGLIGTIAGTGVSGYSGDGGAAINAKLYNPGTVINDNAGNIYFIDQFFSVVRKISTSGIITTIAGGQGFDYTGDGGQVALAKFRTINDIFFDNAGNLYIADWWTSVVRKVNMTTGIITTVIGTGVLGFSGDGGPATNANTNGTQSIVVDNGGNIYVADADNKRIRKVNSAGIITTIAGTGVTGNTGDGGPATAATFYRPVDLALDASGNLYVYDTIGVVRMITPSGIISRYAGTGVSGYSGDGGAPLAARIKGPSISIDANQVMYISDISNNRIRKIYCPEIIIEGQSYVDTSICVQLGDSARFFIEAINASGYQWQLNTGTGWNNITNSATYSGATTPVLKVRGIAGSMNNYQYRCRAYNNCSELFSLVFNLHVFLSVTPAVSISPSTNNICPGTNVTFTATGTNAGASPYYTWYRNGQPFGNGSPFTTAVLANADVVTCLLTANNFCAASNNAISNPVTIFVNPGPSIVIATISNTICSGTSATFTATVANPGTSPVYQWKKNGLNVGANSTTYTSNALANGDIITCTYTSNVACGSSILTSSTITMNVNMLSSPTVYINVQGGCLNAFLEILSGSPVTFNATVTNGGPSPVYQWKKNGVNVGTNSPVYTGVIDFVDVITCVITSNSACATTTTATSNAVSIDFGAGDADPAITLAASNDMCEAGIPVVFTATTTGSSLVFQWKKNGVNIGTNSNTYTENSPVDGDVFSCTVTSNSGCVGNRTAHGSIIFSCAACGPPGTLITTIVAGVNRPLGAVKGYGGNIYYTHGSKVSMLTPSGNNVLLAGTNIAGYAGDGGPATAALLSFPAVVITGNDGTIYFNDFDSDVLRKIDPVTGIITTIANILGTGGEGSPLNLARFQSIEDIFLDNAGNLYIVDAARHVVKKVNLATNQTYTIAGTGVAGFSGDGGQATMAQLRSPSSVAIDNLGNIYITDEGNFRVRKIDPAGIISTIAGTGVSGKGGDDGPAIIATLFKPHDLSIDNAGNLYIGDWGNGIRKITLDGIIKRVAGNGTWGYSGDSGAATSAQTVSTNVSVDAENNIYISDFDFNAIRKVSCPFISINRHPADTTLCNTPGNISFSIKACNSPSYQWQVNSGSGWTDISNNTIYSGATESKLNVTGANTSMNNYQYRCRAWSDCNTVFSSPAVLIVRTVQTPAVAIITSTGTICQGANSIFTATPQFGGTTPSYQWKKNGINVGTNSNNYTGIGLVNGDLITCVLTASADECVTTPTATSNTITIAVNPIVTPTINITATANNICAGSPVTFTLMATNGGSTPFYQWQKNGINVGAGITYTDNTLITGDVIRCALISNAPCTAGSGWVFSNDVIMNIVTAVTPTIAIATSGNNVCAGTPVTFNAAITNGGALPVYQWKKNGLNVGASNNSYTDNTLVNGDIISCVLTSGSACATVPSVTSNGVTMIINPVTPPSITIAASSTTICGGTPVTFTSLINNGGASPAYQWKKNGLNVGTNSNSYTDNTLNNGDIISCVLTASGTCAVPATATSNTMAMIVNPLLPPSISITSSGNTICAGTPVTFSSAIINGGALPVYQWKKNGVNVGTNNNSYTDNTLNNADIISCELSSNAVCATPAAVTSNNLAMIVNPLLSPSISITASANTICAGTPVTFSSAIINGGSLPVYQWKKNGVNSGTNSNSYTDNTLNNGDIITCVLGSNAVCATPVSVTSNNVTMVVNPVVTPTLSIVASSAIICTSTPVTFSSAITNGGVSPLYQWKRNGLNVGINSNSYTDNTLNNGDIISCVLTSDQACTSINTVTSNTITMTVNPVLTPTINIAVSDNSICAGTDVIFTSSITNGGTIPSYQWKLNGIATGTNSPVYSSTVLNNNDIITCEFTSVYACAAPVQVTSNAVEMIVDPVLTPVVTISTADNSICAGQPAVFNASVINAGVLPGYEWKKNGLPTGTSSTIYTDNVLNNNDIISCIITANANCLTAATANSNVITMTINNNPVVTLDQTPTLCTGAVRQLDAGAFSSYLWSTGQASRTINVTGAGTYTVAVTDNNGCIGNAATTITTMLPQPGGFLPQDTSFCNYSSLALQPYFSYNSYTWSTGAISPSISINQPGTYWLEVRDNNNCEGRSTVQVIMKQCLKGLYVPNAFTPGHDGKNDIFKPMLFGDSKKYEFIVYNRWGNVVFRTKDPTKGWDGTFQGKECSAQVFVWMCSYQLNGEGTKVAKGTVTLIR